MQAPINYKTSSGLYKAACKAVTTLTGCKKGWWMNNAVWVAENIFNDNLLAQQIRNLNIGTANVDELIPYS